MHLSKGPVIAALALTLSPIAVAQEADASPVDALLACRDIIADSERLACLDQRTAELAAALEAGQLSFETEADRPDRLAAFGNLLRREPRPDQEPTEEVRDDGSVAVIGSDGEVEEVRGLAVSRISETQNGRLVIYLANGQVWRQSGSERVRAPRERDMDGLTAEIESGFLGSYYLTFSHQRGRFRVERIE